MRLGHLCEGDEGEPCVFGQRLTRCCAGCAWHLKVCLDLHIAAFTNGSERPPDGSGFGLKNVARPFPLHL